MSADRVLIGRTYQVDYELTVEVFTERGIEGRLQTWRLDVAPAADPADDTGWRIREQREADTLDGLLNLAIDEQRETLKPLKARRMELRREMAAQPINKALWDRSCRIEAMCEHGPWLASLDREVAKLNEEVDASEIQLLKYDEELAAQTEQVNAKRAEIEASLVEVRAKLEAPA